MNKIFILDTNVLLHDPQSLFAFEDNEVVIPLTVLEELDRKKLGVDEVARNARVVIRSLDELRAQGNINDGVKTLYNGLIRTELNCSFSVDGLDSSKADNKIIGAAINIKADETGKFNRQVIVVSRDINLRVKCDALKVDVEDYNPDKLTKSAESLYSGVVRADVDELTINMFYANGFVDAEGLGKFYPNQYVYLISSTAPKHSGLARFSDGKLIKIKTYPSIWGISSKNMEQAFSLDALFNPDIKLVTLTGAAGSGKTLLSAAAGISQVFDSRIYKRLCLSRPIVPMGNDIGYLPGSENEKLKPWMQPIMDNLELLFSDKGFGFLEAQIEDEIIQLEAPTYLRGRSISNSIILLDEAQNLGKHELKTIISRVGFNSKIIITGDVNQIDTRNLDAFNNGLSYVIEKFKDYPIAAHITLKKGERSELATLASEIL